MHRRQNKHLGRSVATNEFGAPIGRRCQDPKFEDQHEPAYMDIQPPFSSVNLVVPIHKPLGSLAVLIIVHRRPLQTELLLGLPGRLFPFITYWHEKVVQGSNG